MQLLHRMHQDDNSVWLNIIEFMVYKRTDRFLQLFIQNVISFRILSRESRSPRVKLSSHIQRQINPQPPPPVPVLPDQGIGNVK